MQHKLLYRGRRVIVPRTAEIRAPFRAGQHGVVLIQEMLDRLEPWRQGEALVCTESFKDEKFSPIVVELRRGDTVFFAVHRYHTARNPKPSPFIRCKRSLEPTSDVTIELEGSPREPVLTRAYPGGYIPPLPWQQSARYAVGGLKYCRHFWSTHAFVYRDRLVRGGHHNVPTPNWAKFS